MHKVITDQLGSSHLQGESCGLFARTDAEKPCSTAPLSPFRLLKLRAIYVRVAYKCILSSGTCTHSTDI